MSLCRVLFYQSLSFQAHMCTILSVRSTLWKVAANAPPHRKNVSLFIKIARKIRTQCVYMAVLLSTLLGGVDLLPLKTTLSTVGKFGITGAFSIVFLYTPEIFPTSLRCLRSFKHSIYGVFYRGFCHRQIQHSNWLVGMCWWRGTMVERRSLTGELSLSCARPAADGWPLMCVSHPLLVSQLGQLSLSSFRGR